jgi:membrane protease YdiL (CAAX protease family)
MLMIWIGLSLGTRIGLGTTMLAGLDDETPDPRRARKTVLMATGLGSLVGAFTAGLSFALDRWMPASSKTIKDPPAWTGFLASFGAGIAEEIWFRLGCMTLLTWLAVRRSRKSTPTWGDIWMANVAAALLFATMHLPQAMLFVGLTPAVVLLVFLGNGLPGVVFGWLYWRKGLGAAMVAHVAADIILHAVVPLFSHY